MGEQKFKICITGWQSTWENRSVSCHLLNWFCNRFHKRGALLQGKTRQNQLHNFGKTKASRSGLFVFLLHRHPISQNNFFYKIQNSWSYHEGYPGQGAVRCSILFVVSHPWQGHREGHIVQAGLVFSGTSTVVKIWSLAQFFLFLKLDICFWIDFCRSHYSLPKCACCSEKALFYNIFHRS